MHPAYAFMIGLGLGLVVLAVVVIRGAFRRREEIHAARAESVKQAASTIRGKIAEQLAPLLPGFEYAPADAKFLGDPIDYVVFHGLNESRNGGGDEGSIEVVLLDVKSGGAQLGKYQRAIAEAVEQGRVRFRVVRVGEDQNVTMKDFCSRKRAGAG
jgi:predicted Holliday junction resolvase-like endonuclease